jgi:hypothetical protein
MSTETPITNTELPQKKFSLFAMTSAITGALTYLLYIIPLVSDLSVLWSLILAPISALAAIITGHKGKHEIRKADGAMAGKKLANFGLVLGYLYITLCILFIVLLVLGVAGIANYVGNIK